MLEMLGSVQFWVDVFKIIVIDLLLSGDNAIVIALACRNLQPEQRKKGIMFGVGGAIVLRIALTFVTVSLLALPFLKIIGAIMLLWIGVKLLLQEEEHNDIKIKAKANLWSAVSTIMIADLIMSLDNVLGVVAAAHGNVMLLVFGLLVSIPLITWSSQLVLMLIKRFPVIIYAGGSLLGYVAGEMLLSDVSVAILVESMSHLIYWLFPVICAGLVIVLGVWFAARKADSAKLVGRQEASVSTVSNGKH